MDQKRDKQNFLFKAALVCKVIHHLGAFGEEKVINRRWIHGLVLVSQQQFLGNKNAGRGEKCEVLLQACAAICSSCVCVCVCYNNEPQHFFDVGCIFPTSCTQHNDAKTSNPVK